MKYIKQPTCLKIVNLDTIMDKKSSSLAYHRKRHGSLLPQTIRCLVCGSSNCGKTNLVLNLLFSKKGLHFENVYVYSKSLYQAKYKFLRCVLKNLKGIGYFEYSDNDEVPPPSAVKPYSIMIFDDVAIGKQTNIKNYFSMGRHNNVDTFYICQTYSYIPKQLVRDNANLLVLFQQNEKNLRHVYDDHVTTDMSFDTFKNMCIDVWKKGKNQCVVIDKDSDINKGRYRWGFDIFIKI